MQQKKTDDLEKILETTTPADLDKYLDENKLDLLDENKPFANYIRTFVEKKGLNRSDIIMLADFTIGYGYKILNEEKHVGERDYILRFCFVLEMTAEEAQRALVIYGMQRLYARVPRDAALLVAFNSGMHNIEKINEFLTSKGFEPLKRQK